jgi:hypothetical protein
VEKARASFSFFLSFFLYLSVALEVEFIEPRKTGTSFVTECQVY